MGRGKTSLGIGGLLLLLVAIVLVSPTIGGWALMILLGAVHSVAPAVPALGYFFIWKVWAGIVLVLTFAALLINILFVGTLYKIAEKFW